MCVTFLIVLKNRILCLYCPASPEAAQLGIHFFEKLVVVHHLVRPVKDAPLKNRKRKTIHSSSSN